MFVKRLPLVLAISSQLVSVNVCWGTPNEAVAAQPSTQPDIQQLMTQELSNDNDNDPHLALLLEVQALKYELERLKFQDEKARLLLEQAPALQAEKSDIVRLTIERDKQLLSNELQKANSEQQLNVLRALKELTDLENAIEEQKQRKTLISLTVEKDKLVLKNELADQKQKVFVSELERDKQTLALKNDIQEQRNRQQELTLAMERSKLEFELVKLEYEKAKRDFEDGTLAEKIARRTELHEWEREIDKTPEYLQQPFVDGRLIISDRRIALNGPIMSGTSTYITERIQYFNNKDPNYPIFLVIDNCPGGSVMEGAQVLKAMEGSQAPVYVVVKSLAASMAAVITALAEQSFAYPNALIIHHQIWSGMLGNMTQQAEFLKMTQDWSQRMMGPVADKMGLSLEQMILQMYEHNSDGNWRAFADQATTLKWVDHVIQRIDETAFLTQPTEQKVPELNFFLSMPEQTDKDGKLFVQLPPPSAGDVYHLYNPHLYYRW